MVKTQYMTPLNIFLSIALVLSVTYLLYLFYKKTSTEHFTEDEYNSRLDVIKVFDLVLNRKPSPEEIEKYSKFNNEQDILVHVLKDFKKESSSKKDKEKEKNNEKVEMESKETSEEVTTDDVPLTRINRIIQEDSQHEAENIEETQPQLSAFNKITDTVASLTDKIVKTKETWQQSGMEVEGDRICVNKHYLKQILDDVQSKIDSVRVLLK